MGKLTKALWYGWVVAVAFMVAFNLVLIASAYVAVADGDGPAAVVLGGAALILTIALAASLLHVLRGPKS